jgi:hypothetical protein
LLEPAWHALRMAIPEAGLPELRVLRRVAAWAEPGARAWQAAVSRRLCVPKAPWVDESSVGLAFAELPDPFAKAQHLEELPFDVFRADASTLDLWAHDPRGSGG